MYSYKQTYLEQKAARPWRGWAAFGLIAAILIYLGVTWGVQSSSLPEMELRVGGSSVLDESVYAVAHTFRGNQALETVSISLVGEVADTIVIYNDGRIEIIDEATRAELLIEAARPAWWFLPSTAGVVYVREGEHVAAHRIASMGHDVVVRTGNEAPATESRLPGLENLLAGARCEGSCSSALAEYNIDGFEGLAYDLYLVENEGTSSPLVVFGTDEDPETVISFISELSKLGNTEEIVRQTSDGNRIAEIVPLQEPTVAEFEDGESLTLLIGGEQLKWTLELRPEVVFGYADVDIGNKYWEGLSTQTLTKKLCGAPTAAFWRVGDLELPESDASQTLFFVNNGNAWKTCFSEI